MSAKCPKCNKSVYFNEGIGVLGKRYHSNCLKCEFPGCTARLTGGNFVSKSSHNFCNKHSDADPVELGLSQTEEKIEETSNIEDSKINKADDETTTTKETEIKSGILFCSIFLKFHEL
jgi:hypothetical protein